MSITPSQYFQYNTPEHFHRKAKQRRIKYAGMRKIVIQLKHENNNVESPNLKKSQGDARQLLDLDCNQ